MLDSSKSVNENLLSTGHNESRDGCFAHLQESPFWNIFLLALAWALTLTTSTLLTTIGPLSATDLGASKSVAAFTIGVFLIGAAVSSVPSGWLFRVYGRFWGFTVGCLCQFIGSVFGSLAIASNNLILLYLGCFFIGLGQGLGQFYRFSAVEITPDNFKSKAVTYVLSGGILAAFLGPTTANYSMDLVGQNYQGSYMMIALIAVLNEIVIFFVKFPERPQHDNNNTSQTKMGVSVSVAPKDEMRTSWQIISQPLFIISCTVATLAHTIMVMVMSNVTIDMLDHGYSFNWTARVMEVHFFAMFAPGFLSGQLITKYGTFAVAFVGGIIFAASAFVLAIEAELWNFFLGMILIGFAWNLCFSAGTVMLTSSYKPIEATEVQAINDFILFTVAGAGSLISGLIYADLGWLNLIYFNTALMALYMLLFTYIWFFSVKTTGPSDRTLSVARSGIHEDLLDDSDESELRDTYGTENVLSHGERNSFANVIQEYRKSRSFATYQEVDGTADEMAPLRSISVA